MHQNVFTTKLSTQLNFTYMLPHLYQHSFHAWEIQYQTDTKKCIQSYLSCPAAVLSVDPLPLCYDLSFVHRSLSPKMSRIGLHPDGLCDQCEVPETVEHVIEVCSKFTRGATTSETHSNDLGIHFSTPEILRSTAAAKHVEAFVREFGIHVYILFIPAVTLQDLAVMQCHSPLIIINK